MFSYYLLLLDCFLVFFLKEDVIIRLHEESFFDEWENMGRIDYNGGY